ncbi:MAG: hypothetical protein K2H29_11365 [Oscillospiraceae bacterium]|nr:hypothetical protein [Oscillospiraceae bacterium]
MAEFELSPEILQTAAGSITGDIAQIQTAVYGREVRASIAECLYLLLQRCEQSASELTDIRTEFSEDAASAMTILTQLQGITSNLQEQLEIAENVIYPYLFPNVTGSDTVSALDAALIQSFTTGVGIGTYTNDPAGWAQFVTDNNLPENTSYPDANEDGIINAQESAAILEFVANTAAGRYSNSKAGWNAYMRKRTLSNLQEGLQKIATDLVVFKQQSVPIVTLSQADYDALEVPNETTLYVIIDNSELES